MFDTQAELNRKILEYHESGFMEDLMDLFFRRSRCKYQSNDGQLQGEAESMNFDKHAGLYLLLVVGIFLCILLMFVEHAVFKWIVSYWRRKPSKSFWKSPSMMFWSQVSIWHCLPESVILSSCVLDTNYKCTLVTHCG